ncbi:MAG: glycosyltransferase, partial [Chthoniobacterales bacterium]|nr:glycosyltransferase [Chthoniobacterales bacterium]
MNDGRKLISIVNPCYNEVENIDELCARTRAAMAAFPQYKYEQLIIDNASVDGTQERLRELAAADPCIKVILNTRNFGHIRSPYHGMMQARGDAVLFLSSDLQDPPEMIGKFIQEWERGVKVVVGVKPASKESPMMFLLRRLYYLSI